MGSVSPSVETNKMREVSLSSNCFFTEFKFSSWQIWIKAPRVTAPDSPDIIEVSPKIYFMCFFDSTL